MKVEPPTALVTRSTSIIPKVKETVENLERVRRFMSTCLNIDLQKWEARNPPPTGLDALKTWEATRKHFEIDWGTIPGNDKPFLMQPGAEKFLFWLQLRPKFVNREIELGDGHLEIISHVVFYHKVTKEEVFEGPDCSCSTMETNFRFVWAIVEKEDEPSPERKLEMKAVKMGQNRWHKEWKKNKIVWEGWRWFQRTESPNISNERNRVRQMGQKRALVKGVKNMGAISEIFTADPSEWDVPAEDTQGSPENDMDYTDGGRLILRDGVSPSGRHRAGRMTSGLEAMVRVKRRRSRY